MIINKIGQITKSIIKLDSLQMFKNLCSLVGYEYHDGDDERVFEYTITDETPDRYGDIMRYKGCDWGDYYPRNPVVVFSHKDRDLPVGKVLNIWIDDVTKSVKAWILYFGNDVDTSGFSDVVFKFVKSGALPACSIGFLPKENGIYYPKDDAERKDLGLGRYGRDFRSWNLLEVSPCSVPANPNALAKFLDSNKSDFSKSQLEIVEKYFVSKSQSQQIDIDTLLSRIDDFEKRISVVEGKQDADDEYKNVIEIYKGIFTTKKEL